MGSTDRVRPDRGFVDPKDLPKGPGGRPLCRFCGVETKPPRRTFCSEACVHRFKIQSSQGYAREKVLERDRGVCAICGLDTLSLKQLLYKVRSEKGWGPYEHLLKTYKLKYGYDFALHKHYWEADHKIAVVNGGGACDLDNLQTLCVPCHRKKTKHDLRKLKQHRQHK